MQSSSRAVLLILLLSICLGLAAYIALQTGVKAGGGWSGAGASVDVGSTGDTNGSGTESAGTQEPERIPSVETRPTMVGRFGIRCVAQDPAMAGHRAVIRVRPYLGAGLIDDREGYAELMGELGARNETPTLPYGLYLVTCVVGREAHGSRAVVLDRALVEASIDVLTSRAVRDFNVLGFFEDGQPAAGASIEVVGRRNDAPRNGQILRESAQLDENGRWTYRGGRLTEALIYVDGGPEHLGLHYTGSIDTYRESDSIVRIRLEPGGRLTFTLAGQHREGDRVVLLARGSDSELALRRVLPVRGTHTKAGRFAAGAYYARLERRDASGAMVPASDLARVKVCSGDHQWVRLQTRAPRSLRGRVVDRAGTPVDRVRVIAYRRPVAAKVSVAEQRLGTNLHRLRYADRKHLNALDRVYEAEVVNGEYTLTGLAQGVYDVDVLGDALAARRVSVDLTVQEEAELEHVVGSCGGLSGIAAPGLAGFVGLKRIGEMSIRYLCSVGRSFRLEGVITGTYDVLLVSDLGQEWMVARVEIRPGQYSFVRVSPELVAEGKRLRGRVVRNGNGVGGVRVTVNGQRTHSRPDGSFELATWPNTTRANVLFEYAGLRWRMATPLENGRVLLELGAQDVSISVQSPDLRRSDGHLRLRFLDGPVVRSSSARVVMDIAHLPLRGGSCRLKGLYAGRYEAEVVTDDGRFVAKTRFNADEASVVLRSRDTALLHVDVATAAGLPVPGTKVRIWYLPGLRRKSGGLSVYKQSGNVFVRTVDMSGRASCRVPTGGVFVVAQWPPDWPESEGSTPSRELMIAGPGPHFVKLILR